MINLENVTVTYDRHPAIHHISGRFDKGSMTAIVGPNGAGKSTLLKAIAGYLKINEGKIETELNSRDIAYLPQQSDIEIGFPISVLEFILFAYWQSLGSLPEITNYCIRKARLALRMVELEGFENRPIGTLSTGQFQRVQFARTILQDAKLILLDEPFNAIDTRTSEDLMKLINEWHKEKRTVIAVLHDIEMVRENFPNAVVIARECVCWGKTSEVLIPSNIQKARKIMGSWDEEAEICKL